MPPWLSIPLMMLAGLPLGVANFVVTTRIAVGIAERVMRLPCPPGSGSPCSSSSLDG
jgi:hypothetical protein